MALALADSLIAHPEFDATDLMDRFVRWWKQGAYSCTGTVSTLASQRERPSPVPQGPHPFAGSHCGVYRWKRLADAPVAGGAGRIA